MEPKEANKAMIDDIVNMLDGEMAGGAGHVNIEVNEDSSETKEVQTMGCTDCSRAPLACSIPTMLDTQ
jgi:uncharacterized protein YbaR (Trm112 family)